MMWYISRSPDCERSVTADGCLFLFINGLQIDYDYEDEQYRIKLGQRSHLAETQAADAHSCTDPSAVGLQGGTGA